jgi:hypothetical protein
VTGVALTQPCGGFGCSAWLNGTWAHWLWIPSPNGEALVAVESRLGASKVLGCEALSIAYWRRHGGSYRPALRWHLGRPEWSGRQVGSELAVVVIDRLD